MKYLCKLSSLTQKKVSASSFQTRQLWIAGKKAPCHQVILQSRHKTREKRFIVHDGWLNSLTFYNYRSFAKEFMRICQQFMCIHDVFPPRRAGVFISSFHQLFIVVNEQVMSQPLPAVFLLLINSEFDIDANFRTIPCIATNDWFTSTKNLQRFVWRTRKKAIEVRSRRSFLFSLCSTLDHYSRI